MSDNYTQYNDTELAALLCLDKPIDRAEMIRLARADDVEDFAQALEAAMDSQIYVPGAQAVTDMYRAAIARAAAAEAEVARLTADNAALRAQLDAAGWRPIHDTPPMGEEVQVRGRAQYVPTAWNVDLDEWRPAPPQE